MRFMAMVVGMVLAAALPGVSHAQTYELNVGSLAPKGTPWMDLLERFEKEVESESGGRINVIIRPPGVMGEVEMVRETRKGERLQGCAVTTGAIAEGGNIPQLNVVEMPFLFSSNAQADYVLDNVLFDVYGEVLGRRGFTLAVWSENGWRSFGTKGTPIKSPADLKNFKMRSQESDVHMEMYKTFGAQAVQKPMTEVLTALQSNVIDGLDNTALYIQAGGLAEPLDHFVLTRHIYQPAAIVFSKRWFDGLPADLQTLLKSKKALGPGGRAAIRSEEAAMMENFELFGVEVHELTSAERQAFVEVARTMHDRYAGGIDGGSGILSKIRAGIAKAP
ncbi:MAG: TRAP transporter substrate-binding protein [Myxococcales bacterium]|nr:TRAP transporter substrate-binding protein [Myxococcales bacterium]